MPTIVADSRYPALRADRPWAIAHRGAPSDPSQRDRLEAFEAALELGFRYLECDVQATRDGVAVISHDPLIALRGRLLPIRTFDWETLRRLHHAPARLDDLLALSEAVTVNIDLKRPESVDPVARTIAAADAWSRVCVASFSDWRLDRFRRLAGDHPVATAAGPGQVARLRAISLGLAPDRAAPHVAAAQVPITVHGIRVLTPELVETCHRFGIQVHAWTINDPARMRELLLLGVDGVITDRADALLEAVAALPPASPNS